MNSPLTGIAILFTGIWGGAYLIHLSAGTWAEFPSIATAILTGFSGLYMSVDSLSKGKW